MDRKLRNIVLLLGAIFVAGIFLSSYASFNDNNLGNSSTTTTIKSVQTVYAAGNANAIITNYSDIAYVSLNNNSNATSNTVTSLLSTLEADGSVQNYIYTNSSFEVVLANLSAYGLQQMVFNQTRSNTINVGATTDIMLPTNVTLYYTGATSSTPITIPLTKRNYTVYMKNIKSIGTKIPVGISALLARNGTVYNNQIKVTYSQ